MRISSDAIEVGRSRSWSDDGLPATGSFRSVTYLNAVRRLELFARDEHATILIEGPPGSGKTQLSRYAHHLSPRRRKPLCDISLASADDVCVADDLFGHVGGAFSESGGTRAGLLVRATGGTVVLDDIGRASRPMQRRLLQVIERREFRPIGSDRDVQTDVRWIATSTDDLANLADRGEFLPELLARLSAFRILVPALSERRADIPVLAEWYVSFHARHLGIPEPRVSADLMHLLQAAPWPNNLRQLDATIHRLLLESNGNPILGPELCIGDLAFLQASASKPSVITAAAVDAAIEKTGTLTGAAQLLGVHRTTAYRAKRRESDPRAQPE